MKKAIQWVAGIGIGILLLDIVVTSIVVMVWYFWL
jgi:hypothetical protein